jgi:hypothetical protein
MLRRGEAGCTWNIEKNEMARRGSFPGEGSRRLDRILIRSRTWKPKAVRLLGTEPLSTERKDLFPSDHFGLLAVFESANEDRR